MRYSCRLLWAGTVQSSKGQSLRWSANNTLSALLLSLLAHRFIVSYALDEYLARGGMNTDWQVALAITIFFILLGFGRNYAIDRVRAFVNRRRGIISKKQSLTWSGVNTGTAFVLSFFAHLFIVAPCLDLYLEAGGANTDWWAAAGVTGFYTLLSFARNYAVDRGRVLFYRRRGVLLGEV